MTKIDIFPVKICSRSNDDPKSLESIISIIPEAVEDTFKENSETAPTVNINICIDSNKPDDIEYLHGMNWFTAFYMYSGVYKLVNRVNFAWMQHMIHHLSPTGRIGLVLANGALSSQTEGR